MNVFRYMTKTHRLTWYMQRFTLRPEKRKRMVSAFEINICKVEGKPDRQHTEVPQASREKKRGGGELLH